MPNPIRLYLEAWEEHQAAQRTLVEATLQEEVTQQRMQEIWRTQLLPLPNGIYTYRGKAFVVGRGDYPDVFTLLEGRDA